ncbi:MAG: hypothetical protein MI810_22205 [Flavobacteriales bacterium]|nr:hypothetical protein [Flavobacteriales bacterium]
MKRQLVIATFTLGVLSFSCGKDDKDSPNMQVEVLEIEDTRCPNGVLCIWEEGIAVDLKAMADGKIDTIKLGSFLGQSRDTILFGHSIELVDVEPHPGMEGDDNPKAILEIKEQ